MMNDCRFYLTTWERDFLSSSQNTSLQKQNLLIEIEAGRIMARCNFHIHRPGYRSKRRRDLYCRFTIMRCPSSGHCLLLIDEDGNVSNMNNPPPPEYIDSDIPIRPLDPRPLAWLTNRPCDFTVEELEGMDTKMRKEHRQVSLRALYTEEGCKWLTTCVKCNTSVTFLGSRSVAKARM